MADGKRTSITRDPAKMGFALGLVVAVVGAVILDLDWPAYFVLLGVVAVVGGIVIAARHRGGKADSTP